jgi:hypothetical protein
MDRHPENKGELVHYDERWDSYYLRVSGPVTQDLWFCPWCGEQLPDSKHGQWHDELEALGIDWLADELPEKFKTSAWRDS